MRLHYLCLRSESYTILVSKYSKAYAILSYCPKSPRVPCVTSSGLRVGAALGRLHRRPPEDPSDLNDPKPWKYFQCTLEICGTRCQIQHSEIRTNGAACLYLYTKWWTWQGWVICCDSSGLLFWWSIVHMYLWRFKKFQIGSKQASGKPGVKT